MSDLELVSQEMSAEDVTNAKTVGDALNRAYPGHLWAVNSRADQGILTVQNFMLPPKFGFIIKLPAVYSASELTRQAMRAGGEMLERYRLSRGAFDDDEYYSLPKVNGELVGDES